MLEEEEEEEELRNRRLAMELQERADREMLLQLSPDGDEEYAKKLQRRIERKERKMLKAQAAGPLSESQRSDC